MWVVGHENWGFGWVTDGWVHVRCGIWYWIGEVVVAFASAYASFPTQSRLIRRTFEFE
jgi:hypothetical protein